MERVLNHVPKQHCIVYLDNLLIHTGDFEGALRHLREVFAAIRQAGLRLNPKKCQLFWRETAFLGHVVSAGGVATDPAKITAVRDWPAPTNVSDLRSFLALASYYRRYVRNFATIARPLHRLTDRSQPYVWDDPCPCTQAFNALQTALIMAPVLAYPDANRPFILDTDASNVGVGAVLSQPSDSREQVIAYSSGLSSQLCGTSGPTCTAPGSLCGPTTPPSPGHSQWASLEARDGVLYRQWWAPGRGVDLLQLLLRSHWRGPGEVLQWLSEVVYRVGMPGRCREVVLHQDRLAPYQPLAQAVAGAAGESPRPLSPQRLSQCAWGRPKANPAAATSAPTFE
ncbi:hypothetical protein AAFF_G00351580 [Aldrovandia affinis]|uniref:ribonuclease H n=1 Tax=Aldrovandia affinis TaxID=143900 RepID=A0AAD7SL07_9TELE|nr:hypothetical protein AAFF_G00351580 [Aldrovandia affinis]